MAGLPRRFASAPPEWLVPILYAAIGFAVYSPALSAFFLADDYYFLELVSGAPDARVIFAPLIGRFARPLVVLLYYACYRTAGLTPWVFHTAVLSIHVLNAWLVYLIARRLLADGSGLQALLAGLLFLVFSSHSEAVAWPAGAADPIAALGLLTGFLAFLRARDPDSSPAWVAVSLTAAACAALAKESWIVFPGFVIAYALCFGSDGPRVRKRTAIIAVGTTALAIAYLARRVLAFGSITGGYAGLEMKMGSGRWLREIAKFIFRCFLPAGPWVLRFWPLVAVAVVAIAVIVLMRARDMTLRRLLFAGAATMIALAPVLPLSISIVNTESERFTYTATAFSSMLIVCAAGVVWQRRTTAAFVCLAFIAWHAAVLAGNAVRVKNAGMIARTLAGDFADAVRRNEANGAHAYVVLNLPDNVRGTYIFRTGFAMAVRIVAPDVAQTLPRLYYFATNGFASQGDTVVVRRTGPDTFDFDAAPNELIQRDLPSGAWHRTISYTRTGYRAQLLVPMPTVVLFASGGRLEEYAATVPSSR